MEGQKGVGCWFIVLWRFIYRAILNSSAKEVIIVLVCGQCANHRFTPPPPPPRSVWDYSDLLSLDWLPQSIILLEPAMYSSHSHHELGGCWSPASPAVLVSWAYSSCVAVGDVYCLCPIHSKHEIYGWIIFLVAFCTLVPESPTWNKPREEDTDVHLLLKEQLLFSFDDPRSD